MNERLLLTDQSVKDLAQIVDDLKKWKNPFVEFADGMAAKIAFGQLNSLTSKIDFDDFIFEKVNALVASAKARDEELALSIIVDIENHYIDIPVLGEPEEKGLFEGINLVIFNLVKKLFKAKKDSQPDPPGTGG